VKADGELRVLHLANSLSNRGNGIVNVAVDLAIAQARRGVIVGFATGGGGFSPMLEAAGVQCFTASQTGVAAAIQNSINLLRLLSRFRPHIVHTHMRNGLALAWPWGRILGIPIVMHMHNIHDRDYGMTRLPERIIAVSKSVEMALLQKGIPAHRIRIVLNGILGSDRLDARGSPAKLNRPSITTVAGMMHRKGIAELIEAFDSLALDFPSAHLYLVGGGSEQSFFEEIASRSRSSERIHFEGFQPDPGHYLQSTDIFVLASRRESFGLAIIEAREAGCAIIGSNVDGIPELLDNGQSGLLAPPNNPTALAGEMRRLLNDSELRQKLQRAARIGLDRFSVNRMTDDVSKVYEELLGRAQSK
jgi:glycosyltransferase involved in cell wall biosynthesis